jgi:signal transduction histidine kinase
MLLGLCQQFTELGQRQARQELDHEHRSLRRFTWLLLLASIAGAAASLAMGFLLARRIAKPIYELQLQVESAVQKTRLAVPAGRKGLVALGDHMAALLRKLEETDAAILEQRRRLIQSEKLSAIGEVAAKLAHEILNPLAGMKAAVQLQLRTPPGTELPTEEVRETAQALNQEITRVDQLLRRLLNYARPLSPRIQECQVDRLLDSASEAARTEVERAGVTLRIEAGAELPPLEADPLLITQALSNLLINAAQASPKGGRVVLQAEKSSHLNRPWVSFTVRDEGQGISSENLPQLFHPFFTTKPHGHGLGLAVTQNIVIEHGGQISARNRDGGGAEFTIMLPLVR